MTTDTDNLSDVIIATMNRSILKELADTPTTQLLPLTDIEQDCYNWLKTLPDMMWGRFPNQDDEDVRRNARWLSQQIQRLYAHVAR